jgi:hypothetical protein
MKGFSQNFWREESTNKIGLTGKVILQWHLEEVHVRAKDQIKLFQKGIMVINSLGSITTQLSSQPSNN